MVDWYFDLIGPRQDEWVWRAVDRDGMLVKASPTTFRYYLECLENAKQAGYVGPPHFRPANPAMKKGES